MYGQVDIPELQSLLENAGITEVRYHHAVEPHPCSPVTVCGLYANGQEVSNGLAYLHPRDQFCRRTGRIVSPRRAVERLDLKARRSGK
ncbi:MAG: hypothetical protein C4542_02935 [Dehalococcoidia bacterium]|nr:MAG: hypothetical protein C4542_02935 [Dehalococcoidia bacterium]